MVGDGLSSGDDITVDDLVDGAADPKHDATMTADPKHDATILHNDDAREVALKAVAALKADGAHKLRRSKQMEKNSQPSDGDASAAEEGNGHGPAPKKQKTQPCETPCATGQPKKKVVLSKKQQLAALLKEEEETATPQKKPNPLDAGIPSDAGGLEPGSGEKKRDASEMKVLAVLKNKFFKMKDVIKTSHPHITEHFDSCRDKEQENKIIEHCFRKTEDNKWKMSLELPYFKESKTRCVWAPWEPV